MSSQIALEKLAEENKPTKAFYNQLWQLSRQTLSEIEAGWTGGLLSVLSDAEDEILRTIPKVSRIRRSQLKDTLSKIKVLQAELKKVRMEKELREAAIWGGTVAKAEMDVKIPKRRRPVSKRILRVITDLKWYNDHVIVGFSNEMVDRLHNACGISVIMGEDYRQLSRRIRRAFQVGRYKANMLARTEVNRAFNAAKIETYREREVAFVRVLTAAGACPECMDLAKVYPLEELPGFPPWHPHCRCTVVRETMIGLMPSDVADIPEDYREYVVRAAAATADWIGTPISSPTCHFIEREEDWHYPDAEAYHMPGEGSFFKGWESSLAWAGRMLGFVRRSGYVYSTSQFYRFLVPVHETLHAYGFGYYELGAPFEEGINETASILFTASRVPWQSRENFRNLMTAYIANNGYKHYLEAASKVAYVKFNGDLKKGIKWLLKLRITKWEEARATYPANRAFLDEVCEQFGFSSPENLLKLLHTKSGFAQFLQWINMQMELKGYPREILGTRNWLEKVYAPAMCELIESEAKFIEAE
ncbi:MAG: minor capsid protein [Methanosarcinales archaeon]